MRGAFNPRNYVTAMQRFFHAGRMKHLRERPVPRCMNAGTEGNHTEKAGDQNNFMLEGLVLSLGIIWILQCKKRMELPCREDCFFRAGKVLWYSNTWRAGTHLYGRLFLPCREDF